MRLVTKEDGHSQENKGKQFLGSISEQGVWIKGSHSLPPTFKSPGPEKASEVMNTNQERDLRRKQELWLSHNGRVFVQHV